MNKHVKDNNKSISLSPLTFDEAVTDILKVKPEPKETKKKPAAKKSKRT